MVLGASSALDAKACFVVCACLHQPILCNGLQWALRRSAWQLGATPQKRLMALTVKLDHFPPRESVLFPVRSVHLHSLDHAVAAPHTSRPPGISALDRTRDRRCRSPTGQTEPRRARKQGRSQRSRRDEPAVEPALCSKPSKLVMEPVGFARRCLTVEEN